MKMRILLQSSGKGVEARTSGETSKGFTTPERIWVAAHLLVPCRGLNISVFMSKTFYLRVSFVV